MNVVVVVAVVEEEAVLPRGNGCFSFCFLFLLETRHDTPEPPSHSRSTVVGCHIAAHTCPHVH